MRAARCEGQGGGATSSTGTIGATGGAGGSGPCTPGAVEDCYTGPAGTLDVGECRGGQRTCSAEGSWGACEGEVTLEPENCAQPEDDDCDGEAIVCGGAHVWSEGFGDSEHQGASGPQVAIDAQGNIVLVSSFKGSIDVGGGPLTSAGDFDVLVAKLAPDGSHIWSERYGGASDQAPTDVAIDDSGNVLVTGLCTGAIDFGDGAHACGAEYDTFVLKLDPMGSTV